MDNLISLDTNQPQAQPKISLDTNPYSQAVPLTPEMAQERALKAKLALPELPYTYEDLYRNFLQGGEPVTRQQAAVFADTKKEQYKNEALGQIARQINRPLNEQEFAFVHNLLNQAPKTNPYTVFEEYYPLEFLENLKKTGDVNDDSWWRNVPEGTKDEAILRGRDWGARQQLMLTLLQNGQAELKQQGYPGYIADFAKGLVPFYTDIKERGFADVPFFKGLLGGNKEEQIKNYSRMPFQEFAKRITEDFNTFKAANPQLAVSWLADMIDYSNASQFMDSIFAPLDITSIAGLGKVGAKLGAKLISGLRTGSAVKTALQAAAKEPTTRAAIAESVGDAKEAGILEAVDQQVKRIKGTGNPIQTTLQQMQSIFTGAAEAGKRSVATNLRREFVNRIFDQTAILGSKLADLVQQSIRVERVPAVLALENRVREIANGMRELYPGLNNRVLDIKVRKDELNNLVADFFLGDEGAVFFRNQTTAKGFAKTFPSSKVQNVEVAQKGTGWHLVVTRPIPETAQFVREGLLDTVAAKTPDSWLNRGTLGRLITPEETMAAENLMNRKAATYGLSNYFKLARETGKDIAKLKGWNIPGMRNKWLDFQDVVSESRKMPNLEDGQPRGRLFDNIDDLNTLYMNRTGRLPDEQEVAAYFAYRNQELLHNAWRDINIYKGKRRLGANTYEVSLLEKGAETERSMPIIKKEFDAVPILDIPGSGAILRIIGRNVGTEQVLDAARHFKTRAGKYDREAIQKGTRKLLQVVDQDRDPFQFFGNKVGQSKIEYVLTDRASEKPLAYRATQWRPPEYDYDHYVAQSIIRKDPVTGLVHYEGQRNIAATNLSAIGQGFAKQLNTIREFIKDNKMSEARAYHASVQFPREFDDVLKWFEPQIVHDTGMVIPPMLNKDHPIMVVPRGKLTIDLDKDLERTYGDNFRNAAAKGYGRYFGNKYDSYDFFSLGDKGTRGNPLYSISDVKHLDPFTSINRAMNRVINSSFMDDYKIFSVEHWLQEAKDLLRDSDERIASSPYSVFFNPQFKEGADVGRKQALLTSQFQIKQFLGIQNSSTTFLHNVAQTLANSIYAKFGPKAAIVPTYLLPKLRDPFAVARSLTFDAKLGLFAVPQLLVQMNSYTTIWGVAGPKFAAPGTKAALLHSFARINDNPEVLNYYDKIASSHIIPGTSRWKPGEWIEARNMFINSGFDSIGTEHILRDNLSRSIIADRTGEIADAGRFFFREGERQVRGGAFYTAYREIRDANPLVRFGNDELRQILQRADTLYANMSRASASAIHQGVFSLPTQFFSYNIRLAELFLGKRLTQTERARLFMTYGAIYGVPGAFGLSGLPLPDYFKKIAQEDGYQVGENWLNTAFTEGGVAAALYAMSGNWYNVNERYGVQGIQSIEDALKGDKPFMESMFGAAGSTLGQALRNSSGMWNAIVSMVKGDGKFKLKFEDFVDPFMGISGVANVKRAIYAFNTGKWLSANERYITDASTRNAIFMYLTGLQPAETAAIRNMNWTLDDEKAMEKEGLQKFIREYHRAFDLGGNDPQQAQDYYNRGLVYLESHGFPHERLHEAFMQATRGHESLVNETTYRYLSKPSELRAAPAQEGLIRWLNQQQRQ